MCISEIKSVYVASVYWRRPIDNTSHVVGQYVRLQAGREGGKRSVVDRFWKMVTMVLSEDPLKRAVSQGKWDGAENNASAVRPKSWLIDNLRGHSTCTSRLLSSERPKSFSACQLHCASADESLTQVVEQVLEIFDADT